MMPGHSAGKIPPAKACSCRVIATMTDLVCASLRAQAASPSLWARSVKHSYILGGARRGPSVLDGGVGRWLRRGSREGAMLESQSQPGPTRLTCS